MCDLRDGFVLCSCAGEALEDPDWVLERHDADIVVQRRIGRAFVPRYSKEERDQLDVALAALRAGSAFDFDYTPLEGDVLRLRVSPEPGQTRWLRFRVEAGAWVVDRSNALMPWRQQMVEQDRGRCETT